MLVSQSPKHSSRHHSAARRDRLTDWGALRMSISAMGPRRMTEPTTELSCEMRVVAEAARISDLVDGLPRAQQGAAMQQTRSMIQTDRMYEVCVRRIPHTEELLKVPQRNPRLDRHLRRTQIRVGEAISDDI